MKCQQQLLSNDRNEEIFFIGEVPQLDDGFISFLLILFYFFLFHFILFFFQLIFLLLCFILSFYSHHYY